MKSLLRGVNAATGYRPRPITELFSNGAIHKRPPAVATTLPIYRAENVGAEHATACHWETSPADDLMTGTTRADLNGDPRCPFRVLPLLFWFS